MFFCLWPSQWFSCQRGQTDLWRPCDSCSTACPSWHSAKPACSRATLFERPFTVRRLYYKYLWSYGPSGLCRASNKIRNFNDRPFIKLSAVERRESGLHLWSSCCSSPENCPVALLEALAPSSLCLAARKRTKFQIRLLIILIGGLPIYCLIFQFNGHTL